MDKSFCTCVRNNAKKNIPTNGYCCRLKAWEDELVRLSGKESIKVVKK